jgi:hypothetical protein
LPCPYLPSFAFCHAEQPASFCCPVVFQEQQAKKIQSCTC